MNAEFGLENSPPARYRGWVNPHEFRQIFDGMRIKANPGNGSFSNHCKNPGIGDDEAG